MLKPFTRTLALLAAFVASDAMAVCWTEGLDPGAGKGAQSSTSTVPENNVGEYLYDSATGTMYLVDSWYDPNPDALFANSDLVEYQSNEEFAGGSMNSTPSAPEAAASSLDCFDPNPRGTPLPGTTTTGRVPPRMRLPPSGLAYVYRISGWFGFGRTVVPSITAARQSAKTCADDVGDRHVAATQIANQSGQWRVGRDGHDYVVTNADGTTDTWTFGCRCPGSVTLLLEPRVPCTPSAG